MIVKNCSLICSSDLHLGPLIIFFVLKLKTIKLDLFDTKVIKCFCFQFKKVKFGFNNGFERSNQIYYLPYKMFGGGLKGSLKQLYRNGYNHV